MDSPYADFYALPLPKKQLRTYRKIATAASKIFLKHGALEYREYAGDDLRPAFGCAAYPRTLKAKAGETVICSFVGFKSRDRTMKLIMSDPKLAEMMSSVPVFDMKRMVYGGFKRIV